MPGARGEHPPPDRRGHRLDQLGIPGGGGADRLLEARRVAGQQAVQRFLVDDGRNAEPGLLDQVALDLVGERRDLTGAQVGRPGQSRDLADATSEEPSGTRMVERPDPDDLERPDRPELGDLLLDGHPAEQIGATRSSIDRLASR